MVGWWLVWLAPVGALCCTAVSFMRSYLDPNASNSHSLRTAFKHWLIHWVMRALAWRFEAVLQYDLQHYNSVSGIYLSCISFLSGSTPVLMHINDVMQRISRWLSYTMRRRLSTARTTTSRPSRRSLTFVHCLSREMRIISRTLSESATARSRSCPHVCTSNPLLSQQCVCCILTTSNQRRSSNRQVGHDLGHFWTAKDSPIHSEAEEQLLLAGHHGRLWRHVPLHPQHVSTAEDAQDHVHADGRNDAADRLQRSKKLTDITLE